MSQTKTPGQITKARLERFGLVTAKNPFVYVLAACFLVTYISPGTTPIVVLGKDATVWTNWFLSLVSLWWAVNFIIFMTRNDHYKKSDELTIVNGETVEDEVVGNRQDVWLYVGAIAVLVLLGLLQQFVAGGANIVFLLFLLLLQMAPLAGGTSLQEQAMHAGKYVSTFFLIVLIAFVLVFGPRPFQTQVAAAAPQQQPQQAGVLPTLTPQPVLVPANTAVPTAPKPTAAPKPANTPATPICPAGPIPATAKNAFAWDKSPGSNQFFELRVDVMHFTGSETLTGVFKDSGGIFCQTSKRNGSELVWWKKP